MGDFAGLHTLPSFKGSRSMAAAPATPTTPTSSTGSAASGVELPKYQVVVLALSAGAVCYSGIRYALNRWDKACTPPPPQRKPKKKKPSSPATPSTQPRRPSSLSPSPGPASRYKKGEMLGRGAFGSVFQGLGRHGELVAIKEMEARDAAELEVEFNLLTKLQHPNIVEVKGFEVEGTVARLYLEWLPFGSLHDVLHKFGPVEEECLAVYAKQMLLGLKFLHEHGILHRDIKPKNVLVDSKGSAKLADFGLSRHMSSLGSRTGIAGTPAYLAPECVQGIFKPGSDIWALGATLTELATGDTPWSHIESDKFSNQYAFVYHIGTPNDDPDHHPIIPAHLSVAAMSFLEKCFQKLPENRGSCDELLKHPFLASVDASSTPSIRTDNSNSLVTAVAPPANLTIYVPIEAGHSPVVTRAEDLAAVGATVYADIDAISSPELQRELAMYDATVLVNTPDYAPDTVFVEFPGSSAIEVTVGPSYPDAVPVVACGEGCVVHVDATWWATTQSLVVLVGHVKERIDQQHADRDGGGVTSSSKSF